MFSLSVSTSNFEGDLNLNFVEMLLCHICLQQCALFFGGDSRSESVVAANCAFSHYLDAYNVEEIPTNDLATVI